MTKLALTVAVLSALVASVSHAQRRTTVTRTSSLASYTGGTNEIQIGVIGNGRLSSQKAGNNTVTVIEARGSYAILMQNELQFGGEGGFFSTSGGAASSSYIEAIAFGTYNFDPNISESAYVKGGLGLFGVPKTNGEYENKFGLFVGGGMRFPLWGTLAYNPEARLYKKGDLDPSFEIMFLNASVMF